MNERHIVLSSSFIIPHSSFSSAPPLRDLCVSAVNVFISSKQNIIAQVAGIEVSTCAEVAVAPESVAQEAYAEHEEEDGEGGREL